MVHISPRYKDTDFPHGRSLEQKIDIFEDQTLGWQIDVADVLINGCSGSPGVPDILPHPHAGYAVLSILVSYFEAIAKFQDGFTGEGCSKGYFKRGVRDVFPQLAEHPQCLVDEANDNLYRLVRCDLYHAAMTGTGVSISFGYPSPIAAVTDGKAWVLKLNPRKWPKPLREHLCSYAGRLRDPSNARLRANFEKRFDYLQQPPSKPRKR